MTANAEIWGFLSNAVSGTAETIFKRSAVLNGLDAWRRLVRYIDHGRPIRLENLRREVRQLHLKPIKNLEGIDEGVAEFENTLFKYAQAGGRPYSDEEMKADLLGILPSEIREDLLWHATDPNASFQRFRDTVTSQAAKVVLNRRRLPVHNVDGEGSDSVGA